MGCVVAINADNASSNDTMVNHLQMSFQRDFVDFRPSDVQMHCMAHTVHLAALELLKGIGVVKDDKKETYQDNVTAPLDREYDDNTGSDLEGLEDSAGVVDAYLGEVLTVIPKLRNIIRAVCSSPQQQEAWLEEANAFLQKMASVQC
ncbi:hypothetical protein DFH94DRAFT_691835 [Russula ochroleuca]|uniref:Uncharacterized protein n=1 Tax=Russula ochroleuca TaxID=152965 RepID=A0A9P5MWZ9_9AGAM|nr:hypothetical protein DFH94DRAFT_691835 [Russula ochroleuca]